jgi:Protein of unknown function (DUF3102)
MTATKPPSWRDHPADDPLPSTGLELPGEDTRILAQHADAIRFYRNRAGADVAEIGRRLKHCRTILKEDGSWRAWLKNEFEWSPQTAGRFIQVHELAGDVPSLEHLDLPVSALYLLAAPSTPAEARDEIIGRAKSGESISVAKAQETIDAAKGRKQPARKSAKSSCAMNHRRMKLGDDVVDKLLNTSLDHADELDELVMLNRGARKGELTKPVQQLVDAATAGKAVSAICYTKSGAALRREDVNLDNAGAAPAATSTLVMPLDDIGRTSPGEVARLEALVRELQDKLQQRELKIIGLESEIQKLKVGPAPPPNDDGLDVPEFLRRMPNSRDDTEIEELRKSKRRLESDNIALRSEVRELKTALASKLDAISNKRFLAELERRLPSLFLKAHRTAIEAMRRALDSADARRNGPVLDLKASPLPDDGVTKH